MAEATLREGADSGELRAVLLIAYGLFLFAILNGLSAIAAIVLVYVKRDEARGTGWEGHVRNLVRVFWISFVIAVVALFVLLQAFGGLVFSLFTTNGNPPPAVIGGLVALVPVFLLGAVLFLAWYLYRTLRGFVRTLESKPY